jgi:Domain of unknown function (DUF4158)/Tn3 transposase DDE domain
VQLCTLRIYGRFLPEAVAAPVAITNYLARQLELPLVLFEEVPGRFATETEHWQRIRGYLGWQSFDETARTRLMHWLTQRATDDLLPSDLVARAEDILRVWQIVLPARSTLEELVASVTARVQDEVYIRIVAGLSPTLQHAIDALLHVPPGERTSMLLQRILAQLRATGETIADEDVARMSPAAFAHVIPNGTYFVRPTLLERDENREESLGLLDEGMESEV